MHNCARLARLGPTLTTEHDCARLHTTGHDCSRAGLHTKVQDCMGTTDTRLYTTAHDWTRHARTRLHTTGHDSRRLRTNVPDCTRKRLYTTTDDCARLYTYTTGHDGYTTACDCLCTTGLDWARRYTNTTEHDCSRMCLTVHVNDSTRLYTTEHDCARLKTTAHDWARLFTSMTARESTVLGTTDSQFYTTVRDCTRQARLHATAHDCT